MVHGCPVACNGMTCFVHPLYIDQSLSEVPLLLVCDVASLAQKESMFASSCSVHMTEHGIQSVSPI